MPPCAALAKSFRPSIILNSPFILSRRPMEKLKLHTPNLTADNIEKVAALFPNCVTETRDEAGKLTRAIDFDQLRQELSDHIVEGPRERYHLDWPGKREALLAANAPIAKTLRPDRDESVDFDTTKNLFIEGDNLDALKLLQETYLGKVKMIYIDPPYNTGNDFVYEDDFAENSEAFILKSNQKDEVGNRLVLNTEANGRFHSDWLTMVYPRLKLARNLLADDGAIFASIDDCEVPRLRELLEEVFGEANFVANVIWEKKFAPQNDEKFFSERHDHILVFAKQKDLWKRRLLPRSDEATARYKNPDNDPRGPWASSDLLRIEHRDNCVYAIVGPTGVKWKPEAGTSWRHPEPEMLELIGTNQVWFGADGTSKPRRKRFLAEVSDGTVPETMWFHRDVGHNQEATQETKALFADVGIPFSSPKPTRLIRRILDVATSPASNDIVLDFFAGSGTTAHAVFAVNANDGGNRRCILVQLPEPLDPEIKAQRFAAECCQKLNRRLSIAEITKERIRRAGTQIKAESATTAPNLDIGFRVLKIDTSNMKDVYYAPDEVKQDDLVAHTDNIKEDRTPEDLLFQVLVDWGVDLTLPIAQETIAGKKVFFVDGNALAACFEPKISEDLVKELAKRKPLRAVFRDNSYDSDSVKINVEQIFKLLSPETEIKSL